LFDNLSSYNVHLWTNDWQFACDKLNKTNNKVQTKNYSELNIPKCNNRKMCA